MGESVVLPADAVQHERGLHERPPDGRIPGAEEAVRHDLHRLRPGDPRLLQVLQLRARQLQRDDGGTWYPGGAVSRVLPRGPAARHQLLHVPEYELRDRRLSR